MATNNLVSQTKAGNIKIGTAILPAGNTFVDVNLGFTLPSTNYSVLLTISGAPLNLLLSVSNKTTTGFRINALTAPLTNVSIDWVLVWE